MKKDGRDEIDDIFRSKLYNFESEALPDDVWEKIEGRLNTPRYAHVRAGRWKQWSTAAAIVLLVIGSGFYFLQKEPVSPAIVDKIEEKNEALKPQITEIEPASPEMEPLAVVTPKIKKINKAVTTAATSGMPVTVYSADNSSTQEEVIATPAEVVNEEEVLPQHPRTEIKTNERTAEIETAPSKAKKIKRWSFGMGAGSVTASSNDAVSMYAFRNTTVENAQLDYLNSYMVKSKTEAPQTDIKHHQPVSFGLSASYMLAPRWYLQAGLNYSYLHSDWESNGSYYTITKQRLHFVGLPVSLAYKIAEWNSFMWYASAGFMPEINVAGSVKETSYVDDQLMSTTSEHIRMKSLYWSVHAGTGVSYPIFRFVNAFAEVGAGYYFENGSSIETIHSDKPFNVNFSFGLRLGF